MARRVILPDAGLRRVRGHAELGLTGHHAPFDLVATDGAQLVLVEVKTGEAASPGSPSRTQKQRMAELLDHLKDVQPPPKSLLLRIRLDTKTYTLSEFSSEHQNEGNLEGVARLLRSYSAAR